MKRKSFIVIKAPPISLNKLYIPVCRKGINGQCISSIRKNDKAKDFVTLVQMEALRQRVAMIKDGDLSVKIDMCYKDKKKRDLDNALKLLLDSLNGVMYKDDSQICELIIRKHSGQEENEIVVMVEEIIE